MKKTQVKKKWKSFLKDKLLIVACIIFLLELFLRFYNIEKTYPFGWDQVDNAWAAMNIIVNGKMPLVGMVAKGNSGIYIGPGYYYLISIFYRIFNLNPIASGIFAGVTSIFTFFSIYFVTKKLFSQQVAIIAVFINTVAFSAIIFDRVQWPVNFIPGVSLLIFYFLYRVVTGSSKYILYLALMIGFSFQIHFTSLFYIPIVFLSLPFFPRTRDTFKYILISIPAFLVWLIPNLIFQLQSNNSQSSSLATFLQTNYHGLHFKRVVQLLGDSLIQFEGFLSFKILYPIKYIIIPTFAVIYCFKSKTREKLLLCYLILLWFVVPLLIFSTYRGEISDYYFAINKFIALAIISYLINRAFEFKMKATKVVVVVLMLAYAYVNLNLFFRYHDTSLFDREQDVLEHIKDHRQIGYYQGVPESYIYYYYMRQRGVKVFK